MSTLWVSSHQVQKEDNVQQQKIKVLILQVQSVSVNGKWEERVRRRRYKLFTSIPAFKCPHSFFFPNDFYQEKINLCMFHISFTFFQKFETE